MSDLIVKAREIVENAKAGVESKKIEKAQKIRTAEELNKKIRGISDLQEAVDEVVKAEILSLKQLAAEQKLELEKKKQELMDDNSELLEKAAELAQKAAIVASMGRKTFLQSIGKGLKAVKAMGETIVEDVKSGM